MGPKPRGGPPMPRSRRLHAGKNWKVTRTSTIQMGRQGKKIRNWKENELGDKYSNYDTDCQREPGGQPPKDILVRLGLHGYRISESEGGGGGAEREFSNKGVRFSVRSRLNILASVPSDGR